MNGIDRFHLAIAAVRRLNALGEAGEKAIRQWTEKLDEHARFVREHGEDMPEVRNWKWPYGRADA